METATRLDDLQVVRALRERDPRCRCQEVVELVTDYLEGALPVDERQRFEEHVARCTGCRRYVEQMRTTLRVTGELSPEALSSEAEQALLEGFRTWRQS